ncbi:MAG: serine/threonine transporter SstT, partial [Campylobacter sp.]|nr:serine/threonine transporter SstT [Campylobacter sp.]
MMNMKKMFDSYKDKSLIMRIIVGLVLGAILGVIAQGASSSFLNALVGFAGLLGNLFVGALKAVAPILVFILILSAIINKEFGSGATGLKKVVVLYIVGTLLASATGVAFSFMFPTELALSGIEGADRPAPVSVLVVLKDLLFKIVDNPLNAIVTGNYIGIIAWAVGLGVTLRYAKGETKKFFGDISEALTKIVQFIIQLAPFGIFGLVATTVYETGLQALARYARIVVVLVAAMAFVALVINPPIVFVMTKKNPYPLVLTCLKESGITAFFTRSSAANI